MTTNPASECPGYLYLQSQPEAPLPLQGLTLFGEDENCDIHLKSEQTPPEISDRHCKIEIKMGGIVITDLRSQTGTFVNSTRISEAYLSDGDEISIGAYHFIFSADRKNTESSIGLKSKNISWNQQLQSLGNVAQTNFPVLLLGPSGTGKEIISEALHKHSKRSQGPLVKVNCSALTETLVESELFGHVKGSFTGAINDRKGAFEAARGGTLFLDEIGDLPIAIQAKLLRALENEEIRAVGADRSIKTDVRIIAATHKNLRMKIQEGEFRADLYFRLSVIAIHPPALSERMEDFDELLYSFAKKLKVQFSFPAIQKLKKHKWPGNIRELKNSVARASAYFPKTRIEEYHVDSILDGTSFEAVMVGSSPTAQLPVIKEIERQMILKRLAANQGNQRKTASDLGIPKSTLHDRLRSYRIDPREFTEG
jgi:DNA-binding NtrC family response regulator